MHRERLPQLDGGLFLTDGGIETTLIFHHGLELPLFAAFDLLKDGKYPEAASAFKQFLTTFPTSQLADNAQYWLGEAHYVSKLYPDALHDFRTVLEKYPDSRKIPDALLKIGYCNYELKNYPEARTALDQVVKQYADTTAARLASQRIAKMNSESR